MSKPGIIKIDELKIVLKEEFLKKFSAYYLEKKMDVDGVLKRLNLTIDVLFEQYYEKMVQAFSEEGLLLLPKSRHKEFATNMVRSIGGMIPANGQIPTDYLDKAISSLKTDFYGKIDALDNYAETVVAIAGPKSADSRGAGGDFAEYISKKTKSLVPKIKFGQATLETILGFSIPRSLSELVLQKQSTVLADLGKYLNTYATLVSVMMAELAKNKEPFTNKGPQGLSIDNIAAQAVCDIAAKVALNPDILAMPPANLQVYAQNMAKALTQNKELKQNYPKGFQYAVKVPRDIVDFKEHIINISIINVVEAKLEEAVKAKKNDNETKVLKVLLEVLKNQPKLLEIDTKKVIAETKQKVDDKKIMTAEQFDKAIKAISVPGVNFVQNMAPLPKVSSELRTSSWSKSNKQTPSTEGASFIQEERKIGAHRGTQTQEHGPLPPLPTSSSQSVPEFDISTPLPTPPAVFPESGSTDSLKKPLSERRQSMKEEVKEFRQSMEKLNADSKRAPPIAVGWKVASQSHPPKKEETAKPDKPKNMGDHRLKK